MAAVSAVERSLHLEVEVVEILERHGRRLARVRVEPGCVLDLGVSGIRDLHLGDHLVIDGSLVVDSVAHAAQCVCRDSG